MLDEKYKDKLINTLCQLVRIPSRSSDEGGEEGVIQSLVAKSMKDAGARVRTFDIDDIITFRNHKLCHGPDRQYKGRPTVIGEIGDRDAPALLVLAHSDTVQITSPAKWSADPFSGQIRDGAVYGLGAGDDKWGVSAILTTIQALMETEKSFKRKVIFASTIDEENGVGNGLLMLMLAGIKAEAALYLDGADGHINIGNLGGSFLYLKPIQAINKEKLNHHALQLEKACQKMKKERDLLYDRPFYKNNYARKNSPSLVHLNDVNGNIFMINFYTFPEEKRLPTCKSLEKMVEDALGKDFVNYELTYNEPWFEPSLARTDLPLKGQIAEIYHKIMEKSAIISTISKQDTFIFNNYANIPTVSFGAARSEGPGGFHQVDENINIEFAWKCCCVVYETICRWLSK